MSGEICFAFGSSQPIDLSATLLLGASMALKNMSYPNNPKKLMHLILQVDMMAEVSIKL